MRFLIEMRLKHFPPSMSPEDGLALIEEAILPTLESLQALEQRGTVVAGGPIAGSIALGLIVEADSQAALDGVFAQLPIWPRMETLVRPLTTFSARKASVLSMAERLRAQRGG
jgi:muconolactone delta-isomerase